MKYFLLFAALAVALTAGSVAPGSAQETTAPPAPSAAPPPPAPHGPHPGPRPDGPGRDRYNDADEEDIRELVTTVMMVRISRTLDLTDEQTVVLVRHVQDLRESMTALYKDRDRITNELRELTSKDAADADLEAKLAELMALEEKKNAIRREAYEKGGAGLTTKQKAKLYLTLQDFESQVRRLVARAKEMSPERIMKFREDFDKGGPGRDFRGDAPEAIKQMMRDRHRDGFPQKGDGEKDGKSSKGDKQEVPKKEAEKPAPPKAE